MNDTLNLHESWFVQAFHSVSAEQWSVLRMVGLSLLVVIVMFALFKLTRHLFCNILDKRIVANNNKWFPNGIKFRSIVILSQSKITATALFFTKVLRYGAYALLLYIALPMIFAIFPQTRHLATTLLLWIETPIVSMLRGVIEYLPKLLSILIIIVATRYILKLLKYFSREVEAGRLVIPKFYPDWAQATYNLLRIFIIAFTVVLIFPLLPESESAVFRGVSVFIGVLFSIGSSSVISNMMAGMVITYMRSFKIGDRIKIGEVFGDVIEKTLFVVRVKTIKNEIVTVPNSTVLSSNVINYSIAANESERGGVIVYQTIEVGYDISAEFAEKLIIEAALATEHVLADPPPFVLAQTLGYSAASYQINVYTHRPDMQAKILSDINKNFFAICLRENLDLPVSQYRVVKNV